MSLYQELIGKGTSVLTISHSPLPALTPQAVKKLQTGVLQNTTLVVLNK